MSFINHEKHKANLARVYETHGGKKAILQTWEEWREGKLKYKGKAKFEYDIVYIPDLTRRVRNLFVRLEAMKPIGELEDG